MSLVRCGSALATLLCVLSSFPGASCHNSSSMFAGLKSANGYGHYKFTTRMIDACDPASIRRAAHYCETQISVSKLRPGHEEIDGYIYVPSDFVCIEGRITADFWKNGAYQPSYYSHFKNPCHHPLFSRITETTKPDKNCRISKGNYTIMGVNPNKIMHHVVDKFVYVRAHVILEWISAGGTSCCFQQAVEITPLRISKGRRRT